MNSNLIAKKLLEHKGHKIIVVTYGENPALRTPYNVSLECETCYEVLADADLPAPHKSTKEG